MKDKKVQDILDEANADHAVVTTGDKIDPQENQEKEVCDGDDGFEHEVLKVPSMLDRAIQIVKSYGIMVFEEEKGCDIEMISILNTVGKECYIVGVRKFKTGIVTDIHIHVGSEGRKIQFSVKGVSKRVDESKIAFTKEEAEQKRLKTMW